MFSEFEELSKAKWQDKVITDLKGKPLEVLNWQSPIGVAIPPYLTAEENISANTFFKENNTWQIHQDVLVGDTKATNKKILGALEGGVNALGLRINGSTNFSEILENVNPKYISTHFVADELSPSVLSSFSEWLVDREISAEELTGSFNYDPLCESERSTNWIDETREFIGNVRSALPSFHSITVHAEPFHMEGVNAIEELAFTIAKAHEYAVALSTEKEPYTQLQFSIPINTSYFLSIAKVRALRVLWSTVLEQYGVTSPIIFIQATKSWKHTKEDKPYWNMLQHTTEAMSAAIAGCDVIHIRDVNSTEERNQVFFERVARNVGHVLQMEAKLDKVVDPSAGSFYIEDLTNTLVEKAWALFQNIEAKGGYTSIDWRSMINKEVEA